MSMYAHLMMKLPKQLRLFLNMMLFMATPLFWWSFPAQLKMFIDRMYSLSKVSDPENYQSLLFDKTIALLATAGGPYEGNLELLKSQWKIPATILRCKFHACLFPNTPPEAEVLINDPLVLEKAKVFRRLLAAERKTNTSLDV